MKPQSNRNLRSSTSRATLLVLTQLASALLSQPQPVLANITPSHSAGSQISLLHHHQVAMVKERVNIITHPSVSTYSGIYWLRNSHTKSDLEIALPVSDASSELVSFHESLDGKAVKAHMRPADKKMTEADLQFWQEEARRKGQGFGTSSSGRMPMFMLFRTQFHRNTNHTVKVDYAVKLRPEDSDPWIGTPNLDPLRPGYSVSDADLVALAKQLPVLMEYAIWTGRAWNGKIHDGIITADVRSIRGWQITPLPVTPVKNGKVTWTIRNEEPSGDLTIRLTPRKLTDSQRGFIFKSVALRHLNDHEFCNFAAESLDKIPGRAKDAELVRRCSLALISPAYRVQITNSVDIDSTSVAGHYLMAYHLIKKYDAEGNTKEARKYAKAMRNIIASSTHSNATVTPDHFNSCTWKDFENQTSVLDGLLAKYK